MPVGSKYLNSRGQDTQDHEKHRVPDGQAKDSIDKMVAQFRLTNTDEDDEDDEDEDAVKPKVPFVEWPWFNTMMGMIIMVNAIFIGIEADATVTSATLPAWCQVVNAVFVVIFMLELFCRFYFYRWTYFTRYGQKAWNMVDFLIVGAALIDTLILTPLGNSSNTRLFAMARIVRLLRLLRLVRLLKIFKELWLVANGLLQSMKTIGWMCVIVFIFLYICAIFATIWVGHNDAIYYQYFLNPISNGWDYRGYFRTVWRSTFTLIQVLTMDEWAEHIVRHVLTQQPAMLVFFLGFIFVAAFGMMNIISAVVVESTLATSLKDADKALKKREKERQVVFDQLREIFDMADVDGSGTLSVDEVHEATQKPEIYNKLKMIDFPVNDPGQIFRLLDYDDSGELTIEEFITGCIRMKGSAKSKDLLVAQVALDSMRRQYNLFEEELDTLRGKLARLDASARALIDHGEHVFLDTRQYRGRHPSWKEANMPTFPIETLAHAPWANKGAHPHSTDTGDDDANMRSRPITALEWDNQDELALSKINSNGTPMGNTNHQAMSALEAATAPASPKLLRWPTSPPSKDQSDRHALEDVSAAQETALALRFNTVKTIKQ